MADAISSAPVVDTHQYFPNLKRLQKQFQEESGNGSLFPDIQEFPQKPLFSAIESEELGEDIIGGGGDSGDDLLGEGEQLPMPW